MRRRAARLAAGIVGWYRYYVEIWVLLPLATRLPRPAVYGLAMALGLLDLLCTGMGRLARRELRETHRAGGLALWRQSWRVCAMPYLDLASLHRAVRPGSEPVATVVLTPEVTAQLESGRPTVIVGGHIAFGAAFEFAAAVHALKRRAGAAGAPMPMAIAGGSQRGRNPYLLRNELRLEVFREAYARVGGGDRGVELVEIVPGSAVAAARALRRAATSEHGVCLMTIDRPWDATGAYRRPFAGASEFLLSTGPARLAKAGGAALVLAIPSPLGWGRWEVESGPPLEARPETTAEQLTDALADELERWIGEHPAEYQINRGHGRVWNAEAGRWETS